MRTNLMVFTRLLNLQCEIKETEEKLERLHKKYEILQQMKREERYQWKQITS